MIVTPVLISGDVVTEIEQPKKTQGKPLATVSNTEESKSGPDVVEEVNEDEEDDFYLDEFERSWAERWLNGIIIRGEGWLSEVEPAEEERLEGTPEPAEEDVDLELWEEYLAREQVLKDASELLSLMVSCTGTSLVNIENSRSISLLQAQEPSCVSSFSRAHRNLPPRFHHRQKLVAGAH
jgi:hypothetical protein